MNKKPVNGMRDILPKEMEIRQYVLSVIRKTYQEFGFTEMETPIVESMENLQGKQGGENEKLIFKIMKRGDKFDLSRAQTENDLADSGLRYDLTMPLSRYFANHQTELQKPFKALQIGPVFRAERPQKGRFREFYQCDIDIFGDATNLAETELILAMSTVLSRLGFRHFQIRINDRRILKAMAAFSGLQEDQYDEMFIILDKMDKIGLSGVREELLEMGLTEENADRYLNLFDIIEGKTGTDAVDAMKANLDGKLTDEVAENLKQIFTMVSAASEVPVELIFDPTLVRGMGYYTGPIFEIAVPEFQSAMGGGGRYDEMVGKFVGQSTPACGFSIGFERMISILLENGFTVPGSEKRIAFLMEKGLSPEKTADVLRLAQEERKTGARVLTAVMIKNKKFQKEQLKAEGYEEIREFYERPLEG
ncbi:MAG: histidine--tRNA ligase [Lachnospiraceae bacterium]|nr:histidine--tRNA ligase [Lachnospiraceae bacterium]